MHRTDYGPGPWALMLDQIRDLGYNTIRVRFRTSSSIPVVFQTESIIIRTLISRG